jgi:hypothetical protein
MAGKVFIANTTIHIDDNGETVVIHKGERVREGHAYLKGRESAFDATKEVVKYEVESATKAPGEKRGDPKETPYADSATTPEAVSEPATTAKAEPAEPKAEEPKPRAKPGPKPKAKSEPKAERGPSSLSYTAFAAEKAKAKGAKS